MAHNSGAECGHQNRYSLGVRTGNWSEDQMLYEEVRNKYAHMKNEGSLSYQRVQDHVAVSMQEVPVSKSPDGSVRYGDAVMLYNLAVGGVLSVDLLERLAIQEEGYAVSTSFLAHGHVARNVFVVEPVEDRRSGQAGSVLCLGQPFRLRVCPQLSERALYLFSQPVQPGIHARVRKSQQLVGLVGSLSQDTVWEVQHKHQEQRFEMEGHPVPANAHVIITHKPTGQGLFSDQTVYDNEFGRECEVSGHSALPLAKRQIMEGEFTGKTTVDAPVRGDLSANVWAFLTEKE